MEPFLHRYLNLYSWPLPKRIKASQLMFETMNTMQIRSVFLWWHEKNQSLSWENSPYSCWILQVYQLTKYKLHHLGYVIHAQCQLSISTKLFKFRIEAFWESLILKCTDIKNWNSKSMYVSHYFFKYSHLLCVFLSYFTLFFLSASYLIIFANFY